MEAVIPDTTTTNLLDALYDLRKKAGNPRIPALEFFLQIGPALRFLHEELKITHNDLKNDNVLVTLECALSIHTLRFVLIDFEESSEIDGITGLQEDVWRFCSAVWWIIGHPKLSDDEDWRIFASALLEHKKEETVGKLMDRWEHSVMDMRRERGKVDDEVIGEAMELAKKESGGEGLDEALRQVLKKNP
jgi:serine/threonine protein kinase